MSDAPRVIACTPAWNAAEFIAPTLDSLAAQTHGNFRVLISDDASTDATAAICEGYVARDTRFSLVRQRRRLGWIGNANFLLRTAAPEADYLLFAFHDDLLDPDYVAKLVGRLEAHPSAVMAHSDVEAHYQDGSVELRVYDRLEGLASPVERGRVILGQQGPWSVPNRGVFRAEAAARIGGLKRNLAGEFSADWPWLLHMALLGEFVRVPEVLCQKYYKKNSLSRSWNFSSGYRIAAALACSREIQRSELPRADKWSLQRTVAKRSREFLRAAHRLRVSPRK